ncbi:MAG: ExbD/TolR family protein [Phycisphaerae bacterium]
MSKKREHTEQRGAVSFNMTPMIDCVFLLIIFFLLASSFASQKLPSLEPHRPEDSQAQPREDMEIPNKVIVNVLPMEGETLSDDASVAGRASGYSIDGKRIEVGDTGALQDILADRKRQSRGDDFFVEVRVDWRVGYSEVTPVLEAAAKAEIENLNLTALTAVLEEN